MDVHYLCHLATLLRMELSGGIRPGHFVDVADEMASGDGPESAQSSRCRPLEATTLLHRAVVLSQQATQQLYSKPDSSMAVAGAANAVLKRAAAEACVSLLAAHPWKLCMHPSKLIPSHRDRYCTLHPKLAMAKMSS